MKVDRFSTLILIFTALAFLMSTGAVAAKEGGKIIHEVGGAIMGAEAAKSVTNPWSQLWEVPNLVVADGATFPNTADKNPTLTIMAVAWRAADHLAGELKRGNL